MIESVVPPQHPHKWGITLIPRKKWLFKRGFPLGRLKACSLKIKCICMDAHIHIILPIEKQITSEFRNHPPLVDCSSQIRDMAKNIHTNFSFNNRPFYALLLVNKVAYCSYGAVIWVVVGES